MDDNTLEYIRYEIFKDLFCCFTYLLGILDF
jgi:hypothetical protein